MSSALSELSTSQGGYRAAAALRAAAAAALYTPNSKDDLVEITLLERFRIVKILLMILLNDPYHFFPHRQTKVWPPRGPRGAGDR